MKKWIIVLVCFICLPAFAQTRTQQISEQVGQLAQRELDIEKDSQSIHDARIELIGMLKERRIADQEIAGLNKRIAELNEKIKELEPKPDKQ